MEIADVKTLVRVIRSSSEEEAIKLVKDYGDTRQEVGINDGWENARRVTRFAIKNRKERLKKQILEIDEFTAMVSLISFTKYFSGIEDLLREHGEKGSDEVKACVEDVNELMYQLLGEKLKIDRRTSFANDV